MFRNARSSLLYLSWSSRGILGGNFRKFETLQLELFSEFQEPIMSLKVFNSCLTIAQYSTTVLLSYVSLSGSTPKYLSDFTPVRSLHSSSDTLAFNKMESKIHWNCLPLKGDTKKSWSSQRELSRRAFVVSKTNTISFVCFLVVLDINFVVSKNNTISFECFLVVLAINFNLHF